MDYVMQGIEKGAEGLMTTGLFSLLLAPLKPNLTYNYLFARLRDHQKKQRKLQTIIDLYHHSPQLQLNPMISTLSMISSPKLSGKHFPSTHSMRQPPTRNASRSCLILVPSGSLHICNFGVNPILEKSVKKPVRWLPLIPWALLIRTLQQNPPVYLSALCFP